METIIFKNDVIEVKFLSTDSKGIIVNATAKHPETGELITAGAGWISKTWHLHGFAKTSKYVFDAATLEVHENIFKIAENALTLLKKMHNEFIDEWTKTLGYETDDTIDYNGRIEPKYGRADVLRYVYKEMGENLEQIKREHETSVYNKMPKGDFNNNERRVSR